MGFLVNYNSKIYLMNKTLFYLLSTKEQLVIEVPFYAVTPTLRSCAYAGTLEAPSLARS